jgi:hypothetical protein
LAFEDGSVDSVVDSMDGETTDEEIAGNVE